MKRRKQHQVKLATLINSSALEPGPGNSTGKKKGLVESWSHVGEAEENWHNLRECALEEECGLGGDKRHGLLPRPPEARNCLCAPYLTWQHFLYSVFFFCFVLCACSEGKHAQKEGWRHRHRGWKEQEELLGWPVQGWALASDLSGAKISSFFWIKDRSPVLSNNICKPAEYQKILQQ